MKIVTKEELQKHIERETHPARESTVFKEPKEGKYKWAQWAREVDRKSVPGGGFQTLI